MTFMRLDNIKIKHSFAATIPKEEKMAVFKAYWKTHKKQDRYIVVNHNNVLIDGYIQYLVLKEANVEIVEVKISDRTRKILSRKIRLPKQSKPKKLSYRESDTTYVFGTLLYSKSKKERVWRIPNNWRKERTKDFNIGDVVMVHNQKELSPIIITRIEKLNECPIDIPVKKVVRKYYYK